MSPTLVSHYPSLNTLHMFNICPVSRGSISLIYRCSRNGVWKQLLKRVLWKSCSEKFDKIYRKLRVPESLFQWNCRYKWFHLKFNFKNSSPADGVYIWILSDDSFSGLTSLQYFSWLSYHFSKIGITSDSFKFCNF